MTKKNQDTASILFFKKSRNNVGGFYDQNAASVKLIRLKISQTYKSIF